MSLAKNVYIGKPLYTTHRYSQIHVHVPLGASKPKIFVKSWAPTRGICILFVWREPNITQDCFSFIIGMVQSLFFNIS